MRLDPDFRRLPKTKVYCVNCQKDIKDIAKAVLVTVNWETWEFVLGGKELLGFECAKKLGCSVSRKRENNGRYAHEGDWNRLCVCGHTLGRHSAGSPADCLFYSLPERERVGQPGEGHINCGCQKFRLSRKKSTNPLVLSSTIDTNPKA